MLRIFNSTKEVLHAAAQDFSEKAKEAIVSRGRFTVALSGGSSPKGLYELLSSEYHSSIEWNKVFFSSVMSVMCLQTILTAML